MPGQVGFATKPELARSMLGRALDAGVPARWVTADEAYGQAKFLRAWLEERHVSYVMAIRRSDTFTISGAEQRADGLIAALPARSWQRLSAGAGAHGPREYHWARVTIAAGAKPGRGHWLLARRSISDPTDLAFYVCFAPAATSLATLVQVAGCRWRVEEAFEQAKGEVGLDHYQVRQYLAWYRHVTLAMTALAFLAVTRAQITDPTTGVGGRWW